MAKVPQTVGSRIREIREAKAMTQNDVAKMLGLSRAAIAQWEGDTTSPSIHTVAEVAKLLETSPQWLAFGISTAPQIIYREPEGSAAIKEAIWGDSPADMTTGKSWSVPVEYLKTELNCLSTSGLVIWRVESPNMAPVYEYGDRVIIDTAARRPSPSGTFLIWDGIGPSLNEITIVPGKNGPLARISAKSGESYEVAADKLQVLGRVRGLLKNI